MTKQQIEWCNDKIYWMRDNWRDGVAYIAFFSPMILGGLLEGLL